MPSRRKQRLSRGASRWFALAVVSLGGLWALSGLLRGQAALSYRFRIGERSAYKLDYKNTGNADFRPLLDEANAAAEQPQAFTGLVQSFATSLRGELVATVLDRDEGGAIVSYRLRNLSVELQVAGQRSPQQEEALRRDLEREVFAVADLRGRIRSVRFEPGVEASSRGFVRALLGAIQVVLPDSQKQEDTWQAEEEDTSGQYIARYEVQTGAVKDQSAVCQTIRKNKIRYGTAGEASSGALTPRRSLVKRDRAVTPTVKPESDLLACFDPKSGRLSSLRGWDKQVTSIASNVIGRSETSINLELVGAETLGEAPLKVLQDANSASAGLSKAVPLSSAPTAEEIRTMARRGTLGDATLEGLLAELVRQQASGQREDTGLYLKFRALAYLRPETCAPLGKVLATADAGSLTFRILCDALGEAGSPEAQAALVTVIRARPADWQALLRLIPPLGLLDNPTDQTEQALRDLAFRSSDLNVASTAQLALGNMARRLAETSPERAGRIVDAVVERLTVAPFEDQTEQILLVLGNAGHTRGLPVIARFVSHSSADVRATAVSALRFVESDHADDLLIRALATDTNASVRQAVAYALSFREMTGATLEAQKRAVLKDENENVRLAVLSNLWSAREAFPEVRELIRRVVSEDRSKAVRDAAAGMIR